MSSKATGCALGALWILTCGGIAQAQQLILAHGEETEFAEHVWSGYQDTWVENDGVHQSLSEEISGGKRSERTSRLAHDWFFDVPAASGITMLLRAARTPDRENFVFFASIDDGQSYETLPGIYVQSSAMTSFEVTLPSVPAGGGLVRIRVEDERSAEWATTSDSVHVDYLALRVAPPGPPAAPTGVVASSKAPSTMFVGWTDTLDEDGYRVERFDGTAWTLAGQTGPDGTFFVDEGLVPATSYGYRVRAFNASGDSEPSDPAAGTTRALGDFAAEPIVLEQIDPIEHRVDATGAIHLVTRNPSRYARRDPVSGTWRLEDLPEPATGIDVASDGTVGVVLLRRVSDEVQELLFAERQPGSTAWDTPVLVDTARIGLSAPGCVRYDASGRPAVVYTRLVKVRGYYHADLCFAQRVAGVWRVKPVRIDELFINDARLSFDATDRPRIVHILGLPGSKPWQAGSSALALARWVDDAATGTWDDATWQIERVAEGEPNELQGVQLAIHPLSGDDVLAWGRQASAGSQLQIAHGSGGSWSVETVAAGLPPGAPAFALDAAGVAHVGFATSDNRTMNATDAGGAWSSLEIDPYGCPALLQLDVAGAVSLVYCASVFPPGPLANPDGPLATFLARR